MGTVKVKCWQGVQCGVRPGERAGCPDAAVAALWDSSLTVSATQTRWC